MVEWGVGAFGDWIVGSTTEEPVVCFECFWLVGLFLCTEPEEEVALSGLKLFSDGE